MNAHFTTLRTFSNDAMSAYVAPTTGTPLPMREQVCQHRPDTRLKCGIGLESASAKAITAVLTGGPLLASSAAAHAQGGYGMGAGMMDGYGGGWMGGGYGGVWLLVLLVVVIVGLVVWIISQKKK